MMNEAFPLSSLPNRPDPFVNRKGEMDKIEDYLYNRNIRFIIINGEGGVGKSTLALQISYRAINRSNFTSIIWTTTKQKTFDVKRKRIPIGPAKIGMKKNTAISSLYELYEVILKAVDHPDCDSILEMEDYIIQKHIYSWLKFHPALITIDDLDGWEDWGGVLQFIEKFPPPSSVMITSRRVLNSRDVPGMADTYIYSLPENEGIELIGKISENYKITFNKEDQKLIYAFSHGNPLLIRLVVAFFNSNMDMIGKRLSLATSIKNIEDNVDLPKYLYSDLYTYLTKESKRVLAAIIAYEHQRDSEPCLKDLNTLTGLGQSNIENSLKQLETLAFLLRNVNGEIYKIHDLTKSFVMYKEAKLISIYSSKVEEIFS